MLADPELREMAEAEAATIAEALPLAERALALKLLPRDAAPDLLETARDATAISQTLVDEQTNLDSFLVSTIGLADVGNDVLGSNRRGLTDLLAALVPTTGLTNVYNQAITCTLSGLIPVATAPPLEKPGIVDSIGFQWGRERYRYPSNLPKVAAAGGPHCLTLPVVPFDSRPPFVVTDVGTNPAEYGNQSLLINSDDWPQASALRPDRRSTAQQRPGRATRMRGTRWLGVKIGVFVGW